jgi:hypothetical protein
LSKDSLPGGHTSRPDQTRASFGLPSNHLFACGPSGDMTSPSLADKQSSGASKFRKSWASPPPLRSPFKSAIPKSGVKPHERGHSKPSLDKNSLPAGTYKSPFQTEEQTSVTSHSTVQPVETAPCSDNFERSVMPVSKA